MPTVQSKALTEAYLQSDRVLLALILAHVPVVSFLVPIGQGTFTFAIIASLIVAGIALAAYGLLRGTIACGAVFGACLMLTSAIMIQARFGMIEMHFHIFASLAFLVIYRNWVPVLTAAGVIAVHHYSMNWFQMQGAQLGEMPIMVFKDGASWAIATVHAAFVVLETTVLVFICWKLAQQRVQAFQMMDVVDAFAESKDLTQRLDDSLKTASAESFNHMMAQFSGLVRTLRELSGALRQNADSLTDVSQKSSQIAADQSHEMESVASAMNEMAETVGSVAENAQGASGASNEASSASDTGQQRMEQAQTLTRATEAAMEDSARMVSELVEKVQSIDSVIASINGISEQTNLLALNAAIEAARAGEHGRGFSVVADEVRSLSLRTQEFTDDIRATIADLADGSQATLKAIGTSQSRARETSEAIVGAGDAISQIRERITEVDTLNRQIASASEEQAATSQHINESVQKLHAQNEDVAAEAHRTRVMSEELERIVRELDGVIRDYRVG